MTTPELVLTNGTVHASFGPDAVSTQAIAIGGGRVLATGSTDDARAWCGPATRVVDLAGGTVVPGFTDAHVHPVHAGIAMATCSLEAAQDAAHAVEVVATYAAAHPDAPRVTGAGWAMDWFPGGSPSRTLLDAVVPDRPVLLVSRDGHSAWANSRALELGGIGATTPDPVDGRIEREPDGAPQGALHEGAVTLLAGVQPEPDAAVLRSALLTAQQHLHSCGITGWQDAIVGAFGTLPDVLPTYLDVDATGDLTGRVVGALWWDRARGLEQVEDLLVRREKAAAGSRRFRATSVKIMQDGIAENFTAGMLDPYLDSCGCPTANAGLSYVDPAVLREAVRILDAEGFQIHMHTLGDRAVREGLDALAAAREANGVRDSRHHLAHLQVVHPDDVPRFAELGVTANLQALWAVHGPQMDDLVLPFLDDARAGWQYPFADLDRSGADLCAGSDWPVSSANPFEAIHVAVNRTHPAEYPTPFLPHQALSVETMLDAYTRGSARINGRDDAGTLAPGQLADLAFLDADPLCVDPGALREVGVSATYVGGVEVFDAR